MKDNCAALLFRYSTLTALADQGQGSPPPPGHFLPAFPLLGADYMRRAGPLSRAGSVCRDLGTSVKHTKINFAITWKNFSPASWDPGIAMPGSRLAGMKIYHVIAIAAPARLAGPTVFSSLNFASEQNGSPEHRYFSFCITHKGLSDHKAT